jgi:hypothetical protein
VPRRVFPNSYLLAIVTNHVPITLGTVNLWKMDLLPLFPLQCFLLILRVHFLPLVLFEPFTFVVLLFIFFCFLPLLITILLFGPFSTSSFYKLHDLSS